MIPSHANDDISTRIFLRRVVVASLVVLFGMVGLFARYGFLQIHQYDKYQINADNNRIKLISNPPSRGYIYDRNGILLADNVPVFSAVIQKKPHHHQDGLDRRADCSI